MNDLGIALIFIAIASCTASIDYQAKKTKRLEMRLEHRCKEIKSANKS